MKRLVLFLDGERETTIKLLGVDHDRDVVEMLSGWLKTLGYEVHRASSGKQALGAWQEHQADLIIVDTLMQDVAALTMCRERRSAPDALEIVVTKGNDVHDEVGCLKCGARDSLRQPCFPAQLIARMRAVSPRGRSTLPQPLSVTSVGKWNGIQRTPASSSPLQEGATRGIIGNRRNSVPREGEIGGRRWMPSSAGTKYAWRRPGSSFGTRRA